MYKIKRGSITISFSWVFMIIVGAFFLYLAYNIIDNYQDIENQKLELELQAAFRSDLATVGKSTGREQNSLRPLTLPFTGSLEVTCIGGEIPALNIDGRIDANNQYLRDYPVFMNYLTQDRVSSTFIIVENYALPFSITPLLSIVSTKNLLIFDNQSDIWFNFRKKLEDESSYSSLSFTSYDFDSLGTLGDDLSGRAIDTITFISDEGRELDIDLGSFREKAQHIQVNQTSTAREYQTGKIIFTKNNFNSDPKIFNFTEGREGTMSIQMMAILSSPDTFECSYSLLFNQLVSSYNFYIQKTQIMSEKASNLCSARALNPSQNYIRVKQKLEDVKGEILSYQDEDTGEITMFKNPEMLKQLLLKLDSIYADRIEQFNCRYVY